MLSLLRSGCGMKDDQANFGKVIEHSFKQLLRELFTAVKESDGGPIAFSNFKIHFANVFLHIEALEAVGIEHC